ncbi:L-arabinose ABC transporter ATP-binding protein AraG [bacterium]|nr:L-arabinose ABC transporter ATP-binding protein AraG [bacterium]
MEAYLRFVGVGKRFPGVEALCNVSLEVAAGQVHALVGENGAGKSTLLKILAGVYPPDAGRLELGGRPVVFNSPQDAIAEGVAVIHQELQLVPDMSVAENLLLGRMPHRWGWLRSRALFSAARAQLVRLGEAIDPACAVRRLPIAHRQMVEIAKALASNACIFAFDEPTSSLSQRETAKLFDIIRELAAMGCVILYVSHRLHEIFEICDCATVLRDGRCVASFPDIAQASSDELVSQMVGRRIEDIYAYRPRAAREPALEVEGLTGPGLSAPLHLTVRRGEIVALFGLVGAGRSQLLYLLAGAARPRAGALRLLGRPLAPGRPADAIRAGLVLCPEDRKKSGIFPSASVQENIHLSARRRRGRFGFLSETSERHNAEACVRRFNIRVSSPAQKIANLSGGNQQKCILARWLTGDVAVLLLDEPTRGIDVGARSEIYAIIQNLAEAGVGILLATSDLPEALGLADRILVMRQGRLVGDLPHAEATEEAVMRLALPETVPAMASV